MRKEEVERDEGRVKFVVEICGGVLVWRRFRENESRTDNQWSWVTRLLMPEKMMRQRSINEIRLETTGMAVRRRLLGRAIFVTGMRSRSVEWKFETQK